MTAQTTIKIAERSAVVVAKRHDFFPVTASLECKIDVPLAEVIANLKAAGFTYIYPAIGCDIVFVGVGEAALNEETLDNVCRWATGSRPEQSGSDSVGHSGTRGRNL